MILRVIDKETQLFLRDDFTFDEEIEIGLDVEPAQRLYAPKWDGAQWVETVQAPEPTPQEPTIEERLEETERIAQMTSLAFSEYVFGAMKGDY